jgi:hypothetical protein
MSCLAVLVAAAVCADRAEVYHFLRTPGRLCISSDIETKKDLKSSAVSRQSAVRLADREERGRKDTSQRKQLVRPALPANSGCIHTDVQKCFTP